jgi:hypothetical protein
LESCLYQVDLSMSGIDETLGGTSQSSRGYSMDDSKMLLTNLVFQGSLEQKMEHYGYPKDYDNFSFWTQGTIATAQSIIIITS